VGIGAPVIGGICCKAETAHSDQQQLYHFVRRIYMKSGNIYASFREKRRPGA
jgi:hypothetical protein